MLPVLETPRLVLRLFGKEDAAAVFAIYSDEETNTFLPWFPAKTAEDAAALCARLAVLPPRTTLKILRAEESCTASA